MGTQYHISWAATDDTSKELRAQIDQRLAEINRIMSTYDPDSELSRLNRQSQQTANVNAQPVSPELHQVLSLALQVNQSSRNLFDVTVGPLVNLWGFGPDPSKFEPPEEAAIQQALSRVGSDRIRLGEPASLTLSAPVYIDLSAIAKGWAVDDIAALLERAGHQDYLVEIGGDLKTRGHKPDGKKWTIAIERPDQSLNDRQVQLLIAPDKGLATSGDYRNYFEKDGVRYSHTISPKTGKPITHGLASVSVVHDSAALADAWATALSVAGPRLGMILAKQHGLAVYMIVRDKDSFRELWSDVFRQWFPEAVRTIETDLDSGE